MAIKSEFDAHRILSGELNISNLSNYFKNEGYLNQYFEKKTEQPSFFRNILPFSKKKISGKYILRKETLKLLSNYLKKISQFISNERKKDLSSEKWSMYTTYILQEVNQTLTYLDNFDIKNGNVEELSIRVLSSFSRIRVYLQELEIEETNNLSKGYNFS